MGKKRIHWSEKTYRRFLREGRGTGEGANYLPWVQIHDFPSNGISSRPPGIKTGRIHHLLSRNEDDYFTLQDHDDNVLDIREQFPLRLTETLQIASKLNIRHPRINGFPFVLTTDFLLITRDGPIARTIKMVSDLEKPEVREKFAIEYEYWRSKNIDWKIVTEKQINFEKAKNLRWLDSSVHPVSIIQDPALLQDALQLFQTLYRDLTIPFSDILYGVESFYNLPAGTSMAIFKHLIRTNVISVNLDQKIDLTEPRRDSCDRD